MDHGALGADRQCQCGKPSAGIVLHFITLCLSFNPLGNSQWNKMEEIGLMWYWIERVEMFYSRK